MKNCFVLIPGLIIIIAEQRPQEKRQKEKKKKKKKVADLHKGFGRKAWTIGQRLSARGSCPPVTDLRDGDYNTHSWTANTTWHYGTISKAKTRVQSADNDLLRNTS